MEGGREEMEEEGEEMKVGENVRQRRTKCD